MAHSVAVIDGQTLSMVEASPPLHALFLDLAVLVDSVICCRASPSQKAGLVHAVRRHARAGITLAVGDGANDIAMIQEAHVGIGITGKEGLQAARTSDYSVAQFRFLAKLVLVHGRWNYGRCARYTVATFWKEMAFYLAQAFYQRYTGYTGTSLYYSTSLTVFNTLFSSLCVILPGILDKDLEAPTLLAVPELYASYGPRGAAFNLRVYLWWMALACAESALVYYVAHALYGVGAPLRGDADVYPLGDLLFTAFIVLINTKLLFMECRSVSRANAAAWAVTVGGWFAWNLLLAAISPRRAKGGYFVRAAMTRGFGRSLAWWAALLLALLACLVFELACRSLWAALAPTDADVYRALQRDPLIAERFRAASAAFTAAGAAEAASGGGLSPGAAGRLAEAEAEDERRTRAQREREDEVVELLKRRAGGGP